MLRNALAVDRRCFENVKNAISEVRVDERDLELSFEGSNYSFSLFWHRMSIEIIQRPWNVLERHLLKLSMHKQRCILTEDSWLKLRIFLSKNSSIIITVFYL